MRKIIHCDADCFFAAIEMRDRPDLRHQPMAVGGDPGRRGVISTCNYEARKFGIHSAMASGQARKLCPTLVLLPHDMAKYKAASNQLKRIFESYTDLVEMFSIDEAYLDVSNCEIFEGSATLIARDIRRRVSKEMGITVSAGVATSKFLAKVASEWRKPDGLFTIRPEQEQDFIDQLPVRCFQGVGKVTAGKMARLGIATGKDIRQTPVSELVEHFGSFGLRLLDLSRGNDNRPIKTQRTRKSLSTERTYPDDLQTLSQCLGALPQLHEDLLIRLEKLPEHYRASKMKLKLKFSDFTQTTLEAPGRNPRRDIFETLLKTGFERYKLPVRLIGLGVQLDTTSTESHFKQMELFPSAHPCSTLSGLGIRPVGVQEKATEINEPQNQG
jgi:DNA polymerase IV